MRTTVTHRSLTRAPRVVDIINVSSSADTLLRNRVLRLRECGVDNRIICIDGPYVAKLRRLGIPVHTVPLTRGYDVAKLLQSLLQMTRYLRRERIDLVHTHCSIPGFTGRLAAWLAGVPVIVHTVHGFHFHDRTPWLKRHFYVAVERFAGLFTDTLLSQNRYDLELAGRYHIVPRNRLRYIGNGIKLDEFRVPAPTDRQGGETTITCIARLEPVKNHRMLFEAAHLLKMRGHRFRVQVVGDGPLRDSYMTLCGELGIDDRVAFLGYRDDIPQILATTDLSVLTSVKEGIPRALLEPMAMGLPVVATRVNGNREVVRDGECGFLVALDDSVALADAIEKLITDGELRARMGRRARQIAETDYDEAAVVQSLLALYRSRLGRTTRAGAPAPGAHATEP
jgi:glycosyltransferase involved in cell wall biosynthesis